MTALQRELDKAGPRFDAIVAWGVIERAQFGASLRRVRYYDGGPVCIEATLPEGFRCPHSGEVYRDYARVASCTEAQWNADPRSAGYRSIDTTVTA